VRAVYLKLRAEPYLATLLGGANSASDRRGHGPGRMRRLLARGAIELAPLHALSPGELAAPGRLVESLSQKEAVEDCPGRALSLDFDAFLADVGGSMERVTKHLDLPFDSAERLARLAQSRRDSRDEIARGMAWLEKMARADAGLALVHTGTAA
jgi:hypothetical protein